MSKILENSIWPNEDGNLGNIKVQIPDGVNVKWPEGDTFLSNCVYQNGKLVGFVDTKALIENDSKTTVFPYDYVDITVDKRLESLMTFNAGERCKHLNINYEIYLPKGYKRLEYLESTGTQWIDTGYVPDNETGILLDQEKISGDDIIPMGARNDGNNTRFYAIRTPHFGVDRSTAGYGWGKWCSMSISQKGRQTTKLNYMNSRKAEGGIVEDLPELPFVPNQPIYMFAANIAGEPSLLWTGRIYGASISRAHEMQLNLIPCLNDTGTPCMYDIISQEPLYNEGTGQFLYPGAESQVVTSDLDEIFYAKKTAHGIQKLYHVPENFSGSKDEYAIENGFKQLVEPPMPTEGYWIPEWTETDAQLICNWIEVDTPAEI